MSIVEREKGIRTNARMRVIFFEFIDNMKILVYSKKNNKAFKISKDGKPKNIWRIVWSSTINLPEDRKRDAVSGRGSHPLFIQSNPPFSLSALQRLVLCIGRPNYSPSCSHRAIQPVQELVIFFISNLLWTLTWWKATPRSTEIHITGRA